MPVADQLPFEGGCIIILSAIEPSHLTGTEAGGGGVRVCGAMHGSVCTQTCVCVSVHACAPSCSSPNTRGFNHSPELTGAFQLCSHCSSSHAPVTGNFSGIFLQCLKTPQTHISLQITSPHSSLTSSNRRPELENAPGRIPRGEDVQGQRYGCLTRTPCSV